MAKNKTKNKKQNHGTASSPGLLKDLWESSKNNVTAVAIAAIAAFVPLIVYLRVIPLDPEIAKLWPTDTNYDFFSFYKMIWFLLFTLIAVLIFFIGVKNKKIVFTKTWIYVPAAVYALTAVLSTLFAKYTDVAMYGYPDRFEGFFVIVGYLLVFVIVLNIAQGKGALKLIIAGLFISAFTASLIGLFQFIGRLELFGNVYTPLDFFQTSLGKMLITPQEYRETLDLNFHFGPHTICTTLYNTNFVGSFMEMALMLSIALFIYETGKTRKVILYILTLLIFSNWIGCLSRGGYLGVITSTIVFIVIAVLRFTMFKKGNDRDLIRPLFKNVTLIVSSFILVFFVLDFSSDNTISRQFSRLNVKAEENMAPGFAVSPEVPKYLEAAPTEETEDAKDASPNEKEGPKVASPDEAKDEGIDSPAEKEEAAPPDETKDMETPSPVEAEGVEPASAGDATDAGAVSPPDKTKKVMPTPFDEIKDVRITPDKIFFYTENTEMQIKMGDSELLFFKGDGTPLNPIFNDVAEAYMFNEPKYSNYKFRLDQNNIIFLFYGDAGIQVAITEQGFRFFDERCGATDIVKAASWGFEGRERLANIRGYLWSRTIPLLKDCIVIGNGPDTFPLYFPQKDYVAKLKYYANPYMIIDKPHNMYLQIAVNTGVISLFCVLIIFISYIATSIKIIFTNDRRTVYSTVSLGAFLGNIAYMVTALFNDSLISVSPVFWIMLGMGFAVNFVVIKTLKNQESGMNKDVT